MKRGDRCHHGSNSYPLYEVICVDRGRAWLRDISSGVEGIVDESRCHRITATEAHQLEAGLRGASGLSVPSAELPST